MIDDKYRSRFTVKEDWRVWLWDWDWLLIQWRDLILKYLYEWGFMRRDLQDEYNKNTKRIQRTEEKA